MPKSEKDNALAAIPPEEEKVIMVSEESDQKKPSQTGSFGQTLKRVLGFFLRLVISLVLLAALAAGAYYGLPILYEKYVRPVEMNSSQVPELTLRQAQSETQIADMETQLAALEAVQTSQAESIADLSARVEMLEESIAVHTESLSVLEDMQASLQASDEESLAELERQISLLKSMELLSRARLFLYQSNFGLAAQDVQTARDLLSEIQPAAPEPLDAEIAETVMRLDLVLKNLPSFPVAASDDLNIAWQILLTGIPEQVSVTTTPVVSPESPSTLTPESETTPTPAP